MKWDRKTVYGKLCLTK